MSKAKRVLMKNDDGTYALLKLDTEEKYKQFDKIKEQYKYSNVYTVVDELVVSHNALTKEVYELKKRLDKVEERQDRHEEKIDADIEELREKLRARFANSLNRR